MTRRLAPAAGAALTCAAVTLVLLSTTSTAAPATARTSHSSHLYQASMSKPSSKSTKKLLGDQATGIDSDCHSSVRITNLTPYTWTLVDLQDYSNGASWLQRPPATLQPGQDVVVEVDAYLKKKTIFFQSICYFAGYFTYRADALHGPEFLTTRMFGAYCQGLCINELPVYANDTWDTTRMVRQQGGVDPWVLPPPDSDFTHNPEIAWTPGDYNQVQPNHSPPYSTPFAQTFQTKGNYVIDGTKAPPQLGDILNAMCAGAQGTSCSFTPTGPLTWGIDWHELSSQGAADNIDCSAPPGASTDRGAPVARQRTRVRIRGTEPPPGPPDGDPDWHEVSVTESRETSFSVGGSVSAGVEFELLHVIGTEVSVKFGVETEWSDMNDITKTIKIYLPPNYIGGVWTAPVVGKVTGTLVVSTSVATYTINNFSSTKQGMSPNLKIPPYDVLTNTRPLTMAEWQTERQRKCETRLGSRPAPAVTG